jgi:hypothetical protein
VPATNSQLAASVFSICTTPGAVTKIRVAAGKPIEAALAVC